MEFHVQPRVTLGKSLALEPQIQLLQKRTSNSSSIGLSYKLDERTYFRTQHIVHADQKLFPFLLPHPRVRSANLFYKGLDSKYIGLCKSLVSVSTTQLRHCSTKAAIGDEHSCVLIKHYLRNQTSGPDLALIYGLPTHYIYHMYPDITVK